jgi:hypothetical protein
VKKSTLLRSDKPHAVNMPAGSNVAARKSTQKFKPSETTDDSPTNIQKVMPVKTPKIKPIEPPAAPVKTVRAKAASSPPPARRMKRRRAPSTGDWGRMAGTVAGESVVCAMQVLWKDRRQTTIVEFGHPEFHK